MNLCIGIGIENIIQEEGLPYGTQPPYYKPVTFLIDRYR